MVAIGEALRCGGACPIAPSEKVPGPLVAVRGKSQVGSAAVISLHGFGRQSAQRPQSMPLARPPARPYRNPPLGV